MTEARLSIIRGSTRRTVALDAYLDAASEEQAHSDEYRWIKRLRHADVDGESFRDRFTLRGDSLWWFTELYLHKTQVVLDIHRTIAALEALIAREQPDRLDLVKGAPLVAHLTRHAAAAHRREGPARPRAISWWQRLARLDLRARQLTWRAYAAPDRWRPVRAPRRSTELAAFVHRAFWQGPSDEGAAESYVGPVLHELEQRLGPSDVHYVGVGPVTNFRSRRGAAQGVRSARVIPIERFAAFARLHASRAVWRARTAHFRAMLRSEALREAAVIRGIDCWPLVREELAGIAWLQWPWSARAMDEAAAALDALDPGAVLTYAEAGGWGRALILEARRRGIPSAGLQHGFIYRHWLNYLHEEDEMAETRTRSFPAPTRTLLFDEHAAAHLRSRGRFEEDSVQVTGSPRLDALLRTVAGLPPDAVDAARRSAGLREEQLFVLVTTKEREARSALPGLIAAAAAVPGAVLVIKPHPAETSEVYASYAAAHVRILPASAPLAPLLAAARAVVTVNSTVALDAAALDLPALSIGLPNNLSPFVRAGAIAGTEDATALPALLRQILYDESFRQQLGERRNSILGRHVAASDGRAAARAADAVVQLAARGRLRQRNGKA